MGNQDIIGQLIQSVDNCYLRELSRNYDEREIHVEYTIRNNTLQAGVENVQRKLLSWTLTKDINSFSILLSRLLILYKELRTKGPWNTEETIQYSIDLNEDLERVFSITFDELLTGSSVCKCQDIFEKCMIYLHTKLTQDKFKRNPSFIQVYCDIIHNIDNYKVMVNPITTLPASIILIEDYIPENKIKGLKCCKMIMSCLTLSCFEGGNYYEVINVGLKKSLMDKDLEVTKLVLECMEELLRIYPVDKKRSKTDEVTATILDEIYMESNFFRKQVFFICLKQLMSQLQVDFVKRKKKFMAVMYENLDQCLNEAVADTLLNVVIECLKTWFQYGWCVWKTSTDQKLLSALIKLLYILEDQESITNIQEVIVTTVNLYTNEEQKQILSDMDVACSQINNEKFMNILNFIRNNINIEV